MRGGPSAGGMHGPLQRRRNDNELRGKGLDDLIKGLVGNDTLFGLGGDDTIRGGSGNNLIRGNAGNDIISGDKSRDKLFGQDGDDILFGGDGNDKLIGAGGDDVLRGGKGNDLLVGGEGADLFLASNNAGRDKIRDFTGEDAMDFRSLGLALSDLTILETSEGEAVINYGGSSGFRLIGVSVADLTLENFLFFGDDVPDTPATAEPLAIGETRRASIDFADDTDVFALNVMAGNTYTFAAESDGALPAANPRVRLVDENGDPIPLDGAAPNTVPGLILGFKAERSKTVFLEVDAPGDSTGLYDVFSILTNEVDDFADKDTTTGLLSPGMVINGGRATATGSSLTMCLPAQGLWLRFNPRHRAQTAPTLL